MKKHTPKWIAGGLVLAALLTLLLSSFLSKNWNVPEELLGLWSSDTLPVTVRTEPERMKFEFTHGQASFSFEMHADRTADGRIGMAEFHQATVRKNGGLPSITGVAWIIECGPVGKIFEDDPLDLKEVELWLGPISGDSIDAELRYTQGRAQFPMAGVVYHKSPASVDQD